MDRRWKGRYGKDKGGKRLEIEEEVMLGGKGEKREWIDKVITEWGWIGCKFRRREGKGMGKGGRIEEWYTG